MRTYIGWVHGLCPWKEYNWAFTLQGLCVNYFELRKHPKTLKHILKNGIRPYLEFEAEILLDSGAYPAWKSSASLSVEEVADFYKKIEEKEPDILKVNLDVIDQDNGEQLSLKNYQYLKQCGLTVLPVIHIGESVESYPESSWLGVGGAVPVIRTIRGKRHFLEFINSIKRKRNCKIHIFGVAGPTMIPALEILGVDSGDWMGWRISASMGSVQLPTRQVHITSRDANKWSKKIREAEIEEYIQPSPFTLKELKQSFVARALFNLWICQECAHGTFSITNNWTKMAQEVLAS